MKLICKLSPTDCIFYEIISKRDLYLSLCREADEILKKTGIKSICIKCSTVKPIKNRGVLSVKGCCGQGNNECPHLGKNGCTTQSLSCKLWLCNDRLERIILKSKYAKRWQKLITMASNNHWIEIDRTGIDDYPELK